MAGIVIPRLGGILPRIDARQLPDFAAQAANNCKLWNGVLKPLRAPNPVNTPSKSGTKKSMYRISSAGVDYWLHWIDNIDVWRAPLLGDTWTRLYYTGDGEPRVTRLEMAISKTDNVNGIDNYPSGYGEAGATDYPRAFYALGIPAPLTAPTVTPPAGTTVTRAYVYTFVNGWGEESAISPATLGTGALGTWVLSGMNTGPLNTGSLSGATYAGATGLVTVTTTANHWLHAGHKINITGVVGMTNLNADFLVYDVPSNTTFRVLLTTAQIYTSGGTWKRYAPYNINGLKQRIYRTITTSPGTQQYYYFVAEQTAAATYNDSLSDSQLGGVQPTTYLDMPPGDLAGIVALPGGFFAGFSKGNILCFSEPYKPYAWPAAYCKATAYPIVGLGVYGNSVVVCTTGTPEIATGISPDGMSLTRRAVNYPCMSKLSIVSSGYGVLYLSDMGLVLNDTLNSQLVTRNFYDRDAFHDSVTGVSAAISFAYDDRYYAFWRDINNNGQAFIFDPQEALATLSTNNYAINGAWRDPETGLAYIVDTTAIKQWDSSAGVNQTAQWKSKKFKLPKPGNMKVARIASDFTQTQAEQDAITAANAAIVASNTTLLAGIGATTTDNTEAAFASQSPAEITFAGDLAQQLIKTQFQGITFNLYADGALKFSKQVFNSKSFTLPKGYMADYYEVEFITNITISPPLEMAESISELKQV